MAKRGSYNPNADEHQIAEQQQTEQRNAANELGIHNVVSLGHGDGALTTSADLSRQLTALYRKHQPDLLLAFNPWKRYELHPDHLAAGRAALDARLAAKMPLYYPELRGEGSSAWAIGELWLFNADEPNYFIDVSDTLKIQQRALALHRSQPTVWDDAAHAFIEQNARENGKQIGVQYAEVFRRIVIEGALIIAGGTK